jgi:hypothetical protein
MTSKTSYHVSIDNNGAVMAYGMWIKNTLQQRLAESAIQFHATTNMPVKRIVSLDDNQGADMLSSKIGYSLGYDFRCLSVGCCPLNLLPDYPQDGKAFKEPSEVFLKYNNKNEKKDGKKSLQDDRGKIKLEEFGDDVNKTQETDADENKT